MPEEWGTPGEIGDQTVIEEVHSESWVCAPGKVQRLSSPLRFWNRLRRKSHRQARRRSVDSLSSKSMLTRVPRIYLRAGGLQPVFALHRLRQRSKSVSEQWRSKPAR